MIGSGFVDDPDCIVNRAAEIPEAESPLIELLGHSVLRLRIHELLCKGVDRGPGDDSGFEGCVFVSLEMTGLCILQLLVSRLRSLYHITYIAGLQVHRKHLRVVFYKRDHTLVALLPLAIHRIAEEFGTSADDIFTNGKVLLVLTLANDHGKDLAA